MTRRVCPQDDRHYLDAHAPGGAWFGHGHGGLPSPWQAGDTVDDDSEPTIEAIDGVPFAVAHLVDGELVRHDDPPPREWIFTFGSGQYHPDGRHLMGWYVRVPAETAEDAKAEMIRLFGQKWSMQCVDEQDAGVQEHNLRELPLPTEPVAGMAIPDPNELFDLPIVEPWRVEHDNPVIYTSKSVTVKVAGRVETYVHGIAVMWPIHGDREEVLQVLVNIPRGEIEYVEINE